MKTCIAVVALASTLVLASCTTVDDSTAQPEPSGRTSDTETGTAQTAVDVPTIPDGSYRRVIDLREWRRTVGGAEPTDWGPDGTLTNVLRISGSDWAQLASYDGGPLAVGSSGTLRYDSAGHFVADEPCCGESAVSWTLEGDRLVLQPDLAWIEENRTALDPDSRDTRIWSLMCCGTFTKVD